MWRTCRSRSSRRPRACSDRTPGHKRVLHNRMAHMTQSQPSRSRSILHLARRLLGVGDAAAPAPPAPRAGADALSPEMMARIRRIEIRARRLVANIFVGEYHSVFRGRGIEFSEVRPYQPGDDV